jgi:hypothetical protein
VKKLVAQIWTFSLALFVVYCFVALLYYSAEFRWVVGMLAFMAFSCWAIVEASE